MLLPTLITWTMIMTSPMGGAETGGSFPTQAACEEAVQGFENQFVRPREKMKHHATCMEGTSPAAAQPPRSQESAL
jgi:hypothetical protein